jgi:cell pole-organizing protein PopZ
MNNDESIEDILHSIKRFVAVEDNKQGGEHSPDIVTLSPIADEPKPIDMPEFIRNAMAATENYSPCERHASAIKDDRFSDSKLPDSKLSDNKHDAQAILKGFADVVRELSNAKDIAVDPMPAGPTACECGQLDRFVADTVKTAVEQWIDSNIKQIVESLVKEEISNLTSTILRQAGLHKTVK